jgi:hypothetical protein
MKLQEALEFLTADQLKQRRALAGISDRSTRKADIAAALAHHLLTGDIGHIWERLEELEVKAIAEAVHSWHGRFDKVRFRAKYGEVPDQMKPTYSYSWRSREEPRRSVLPLFFYQREIPEDLRPRLAKLAPPPEEMKIATLTEGELPAAVGRKGGPLRRAAGEELVRHDLPAVLGLIGQGGITVGAKTGLPGSAAAAKIESVLLGGDWYAEEDDRGRARWAGGPIRPIRPFAWPLLLQTAGLVKLDGSKLALTARGKKARTQPLEEVVTHLFGRWQAKGSPDELRRIDLIKGQTSKGARLSAVAERRAVIAAALEECCPVGSWISVDELFRQMQFRGHHFEVTHNPWKLYLTDANYGSLGYEGYASFNILQARYTLAYLFEYLASLGMIDVAYTLPYGARPDYTGNWGTDEFEFLSRYDGLQYIRLNALGAYCLGLSPSYQPVLEQKRHLFAAGTDLDLVLLREPEAAERLLLEQIAKPLAPGRWGLDPDALLRLSADAGERGRIRGFLEAAADDRLPADIEQLLDTVGERATALTDAGAARLIRCKDPAIAAMLVSDPATGSHCLRGGDRLICVPEPKLAAFRKGLAKLGFVLPETSNG